MASPNGQSKLHGKPSLVGGAPACRFRTLYRRFRLFGMHGVPLRTAMSSAASFDDADRRCREVSVGQEVHHELIAFVWAFQRHQV
jgi:hypothetical protein